MQRQRRVERTTGGFLRRLRHDAGGNTLAMMAISIIPITAMVGSGIDLARTYMVQSRLQQACDAGVLAGRRAMTGTVLSSADKDQANNFFNFNFPPTMFMDVSRTFVPTDGVPGTVVGTATASVPMTLMRMVFGQPRIDLSVTCESRLDIANTDVMFVLDITGSMACTASDSTSTCNSYVSYNWNGKYWTALEKSNSRVAALRSAVGIFYDTLTGSAGTSTRLRFGFVPYSTTVNVGGLIPSKYMATNWNYESRIAGEWFGQTTNNYFGLNCNGYDRARSPASGYDGDGRAVAVDGSPSETRPLVCTVVTTTFRATKANDAPNVSYWRYDQIPYDVSRLAAGGTIDRSNEDLPNLSWGGCIEEAKTSPTSNFSTLPPDLNIDLIPSNDDTWWHAYLPSLIYDRANTSPEFEPRNASPHDQPTFDDRGNASCPKAAQALKVMTKAEVTDYTKADNGFVPHGGTYHDIGMIWGGRLLSPDGLFKASNVSQNGQEVSRNIVFITDGDMLPNPTTYSAYGYEKLDQRVMGTSSIDAASMKVRHNARFAAVCESIKDKNITIWVIAYAQTMTSQLTDCATDSNHAIFAPDDATLKSKLAEIATRIAALRLNK